MIYQELALAPDLTVEANIMLGQERVRAGLIRRREHRKLVADALALLEHPDIRPEAKVGDLGVGAQQLVEVARALVSSARVIVFDEPTSSLSEHDAQRLFAIVERLRARGLAIIYISHFLEEARRVAQTFTVLRDGKAVAGGANGRNGSAVDHRAHGRAATWTSSFLGCRMTPGEPILEIDELRVRKTAQDPPALRCGAARSWASPGLIGAGRTTLVRSIFGLGPVVAGKVRVGHFTGGYAPPQSPHRRKGSGSRAKTARPKGWHFAARSKTT